MNIVYWNTVVYDERRDATWSFRVEKVNSEPKFSRSINPISLVGFDSEQKPCHNEKAGTNMTPTQQE